MPRLVLTKEQSDVPEPKLHPILSGTGAMLHVVLPPGASLSCKPHTIVGRSTTVTVESKLDGGPVRALTRAAAGGPLALQTVSAVGGIGDALLAPVNIGQVVVAELDGSADLYLRRNAFVAATEGISVRTRLQRLSEAGVTGLFLLKASGVGKVAVTGYGSVAEISLRKFEEYIVSARHVVAWDGSMRTSPVKKTGNWFTRLLVGESTWAPGARCPAVMVVVGWWWCGDGGGGGVVPRLIPLCGSGRCMRVVFA